MQLPRSKFVRDTIKQLAFNEDSRAYVHALLRIEDLIVNGPRSFAEAMHARQIRETYCGPYGMIFRELNPTGYARAKREQARLSRERHEKATHDVATAKRQRDEDRKMWREVAGRAVARAGL